MKKGITLRQVYDGEWVQPKRVGYLMKCCDCGLIHRINWRIIKYGKPRGSKTKLQFQAFRLNQGRRK